jgi:uncharacterized RDD family membrane protein YckC
METPSAYRPPSAHVEDWAPAPEVEAATRLSRLGAAFLDGLFFGLVGVALALAVPALLMAGSRELALGVGLLGILAFLGLLIWNAMLLHQEGQTLGKKVVGIRMITSDGNLPGLLRVIFLRWLPFAVVGGILAYISKSQTVGNLVSLVDVLFIFGPTRRCLHDVMADTHVVKV